MDKLIEIMRWKRREIASLLRVVAPGELEAFRERDDTRAGSFLRALRQGDGLAVIAEIKRRSPSAGEIKELPDAREQARAYAQAGADCLSILTDEKFFGGSLADLKAVTDDLRRQGSAIPCLRKDFMIHPVQVLQAAEAGAAAILIIVRALKDKEMRQLREAADLAGLDCLYEIHSEPELERLLPHEPKIIGVNNRDLATFKTDLAFSESLIPKFPANVTAISESGIWTSAEAARARAAGAHAILVGEALMRADSATRLVGDFHTA